MALVHRADERAGNPRGLRTARSASLRREPMGTRKMGAVMSWSLSLLLLTYVLIVAAVGAVSR